MIEYRAEIALWALSGVLPLIMLALWNEVYQKGNHPHIELNLSHYFISAFIVRQFTAVWVMVSFEEDIVEGKLSPYLLQPVYPFWRYFFSHIAEQITRLPFVLLLIIILYLFNNDLFWSPSKINLILGSISIFLAFIVRFLLHWVFSMLCFWTEKASALERLLMIPYLYLSGLIAPLDLFPNGIKSFALITPFPYLMYFPSRLLIGDVRPFLFSFVILFIWGILFYLLGIFFWKKGLEHYSGMGS